MDKENSQPDAPEMSDGQVVSPDSPAAQVGPDHFRLPENPLSKPTKEQEKEEEYEARYKGLNQWVTKEFNELRSAVDELAKALKATPPQEEAPPKPKKEKAKAPTPAPEEPDTEEENSALYERLVRLETERYRDRLLIEMMEPGQPGHGLPLITFADNIPVVPPDINEDGDFDDTGQRKAITDFISKIKQATGNRSQSSAAGWTPGVSPEAPRQPTRQELEEEYYEVKGLYGSEQFAKMNPAEQARISKKYYDLHSKVGWDLPGQTMPFADGDYLNNSVRKLMRRMGDLESQVRR